MHGRPVLSDTEKELLEEIRQHKKDPARITELLKVAYDALTGALKNLNYANKLANILVELGIAADIVTAKTVIACELTRYSNTTDFNLDYRNEAKKEYGLAIYKERLFENLIIGLALSGHESIINGLNREGKEYISKCETAYWYAHGGQFDAVEKSLADPDVMIEEVISGYKDGGFTDKADALQAQVDNDRLVGRAAFKLNLFKTLEAEGFFKSDIMERHNIREFLACSDRIKKICATATMSVDLSEGGKKILTFHDNPYEHIENEFKVVHQLAQRYHFNAEQAFVFKTLKDMAKNELGYKKAKYAQDGQATLADVSAKFDKDYLLGLGKKAGFTDELIASVLPAFAVKLTANAVKQTLANSKAGLFKSPAEFSEAIAEIPHRYEQQLGMK